MARTKNIVTRNTGEKMKKRVSSRPKRGGSREKGGGSGPKTFSSLIFHKAVKMFLLVLANKRQYGRFTGSGS